MPDSVMPEDHDLADIYAIKLQYVSVFLLELSQVLELCTLMNISKSA